MSLALFIPILLGLFSVLQATLNREVARAWGLSPAALINMLIATSLGLIMLIVSLLRADSEGLFRVHIDLSLVRWWWALPGVFGCAIVFGLPWAVEKVGAVAVFVALVGTQVFASAAWDRFVVGTPLSTTRVLGALLAVAGVALASGR